MTTNGPNQDEQSQNLNVFLEKAQSLSVENLNENDETIKKDTEAVKRAAEQKQLNEKSAYEKFRALMLQYLEGTLKADELETQVKENLGVSVPQAINGYQDAYGQTSLQNYVNIQQFDNANKLVDQGAVFGTSHKAALEIALGSSTKATEGHSAEDITPKSNGKSLHPMKEFGLTLGIDATSTEGISSQFAHIGPAYQSITNSIQNYTQSLEEGNQKENFKQINDAFEFTNSRADFNYSRAMNEKAPEEIAKRVQENKALTSIPTNSEGHAMAMTIVPDKQGGAYMVFTNRGVGSENGKEGTDIYKIPPEKMKEIDQKFIDKMMHGVDRKISHDDIMGSIKSVVDPKEPVQHIEQSMQKNDNCTIANPRANLQGVLLCQHAIQNNKSIETLTEQDKTEVKSNYKAFGNAMRDQKIKELSEKIKDNPDNQDFKILARAYIEQHKDDKYQNRRDQLQSALDNPLNTTKETKMSSEGPEDINKKIDEEKAFDDKEASNLKASKKKKGSKNDEPEEEREYKQKHFTPLGRLSERMSDGIDETFGTSVKGKDEGELLAEIIAKAFALMFKTADVALGIVGGGLDLGWKGAKATWKGGKSLFSGNEKDLDETSLELADMDVKFDKKNQKLEEEVKELGSKKSVAEQEREGFKKDKDGLENELEQSPERENDLRPKLDKVNNTIQEKDKEILGFDDEIKKKKEKIKENNEHRQDIAKTQEAISTHKEQLSNNPEYQQNINELQELEQQKQQNNQKIEGAQSHLKTIQNEKTGIKSKLKNPGIETDDIEKLTNEKIALGKIENAQEKHIEDLTSQQQNIEKQQDDLKQRQAAIVESASKNTQQKNDDPDLYDNLQLASNFSESASVIADGLAGGSKPKASAESVSPSQDGQTVEPTVSSQPKPAEKPTPKPSGQSDDDALLTKLGDRMGEMAKSQSGSKEETLANINQMMETTNSISSLKNFLADSLSESPRPTPGEGENASLVSGINDSIFNKNGDIDGLSLGKQVMSSMKMDPSDSKVVQDFVSTMNEALDNTNAQAANPESIASSTNNKASATFTQNFDNRQSADSDSPSNKNGPKPTPGADSEKQEDEAKPQTPKFKR